MPQPTVRGSKKILLRGPASSNAGNVVAWAAWARITDMRSSTSTFSAAPTNITALSPRCATTGEGSRHLPRSLMVTSAAVMWPASAVDPDSLTDGASVPRGATTELMPGSSSVWLADVGARRTSAVPGRGCQTYANPWCEGKCPDGLSRAKTIAKQRCKERAQRGVGLEKGEKTATSGAKTGMIRPKDFVSRQSVRVSALSW